MTYDKHDCDLMCERLAAYLEGDLTPADQATAERHLAECATCTEVLAELRAIAAEAATLPLLAPSRDLWSEIEARLSTPVVSLGSAPTTVRRAPRRPLHFAMAAAALIAVSAGTTYLVVTRRTATTPVVNVAQRPVAQQPVAQHRDSLNTPVPTTVTAPQVTPVTFHRKEISAARVYDQEITLLDSLVRTRRSSLDPKTVAIIAQNLRIINKAIVESRAALAKDPKSPLLSNQLDNVLGSKVELLSTIAFLPTQS
jgi:anti-sigma-K factor RskA